jgi:flagellar biogenesis protein FliO
MTPAGEVAPAAYQAPLADSDHANHDNGSSSGSPEAVALVEPRTVANTASAENAASSAIVGSSALPLKPRAAGDRDESARRSGGLQSVMTVAGSLAAVLGVFFFIVWLLRRASPGGLGSLPVEVFEVLGRASLANHQQVQLLRCGGKLLLVATSSSGGSLTTLTEIADPGEVDRLTALCGPSRGNQRGATICRAARPMEDRHV